MMKKLILAVAVVALLPISSFASDTGPGCGLGTQLLKGRRGVLWQVLAATTNVVASHTIGISSGTLGCMQDGVVKNDRQVDFFASMNLENLSQEMAQGQGEHLASLAALIGVPAEQRVEFYAFAQEKYPVIFKTEKTTAAEMLVSLRTEISAHPTLASNIMTH